MSGLGATWAGIPVPRASLAAQASRRRVKAPHPRDPDAVTGVLFDSSPAQQVAQLTERFQDRAADWLAAGDVDAAHHQRPGPTDVFRADARSPALW